MKRIWLFAFLRVWSLVMLTNVILLRSLFAKYHPTSLYSTHMNRTLNSTSMLRSTAGSNTECLLLCSNIPRCMSLDIIKETSETDGKVTCHLFNVTYQSLSLNLDSNHSINHYEIEIDDCWGERRTGSTTGVYKFQHKNGSYFEAYCDMETDGGGWTVIQRRFNGEVDFAKPWVDYKNGFGDVNGEYWLGLDSIHELNKNGHSTMRVDMWDNGDYGYAVYSNVKIRNETQGYRLDYEALIDGTNMMKDSMFKSKGRLFSTFDKDNDNYFSSCSHSKGNSGWWFGRCSSVNPNGPYNPWVPPPTDHGIHWDSFRSLRHSIPKIEIKIRRKYQCLASSGYSRGIQ